MTSVPTWLVVLVPLLAALATGGAGIVGVMLGGRAARRTAERTAALGREDEQRRWNRERREKAYSTVVEARDRCLEELRTGKPGTSFSAIWNAFAQVQLYGSEAAREAGVQWAGALMLRRDDCIRAGALRLAWHELAFPDAMLALKIMAKVKRAKGYEAALIKEHEAEESEQALRFQALLRKELGLDG